MARNCHRSVYHAVSLCRLRPVYLVPETDEPFGISGSVTPEDVEDCSAGMQGGKVGCDHFPDV